MSPLAIDLLFSIKQVSTSDLNAHVYKNFQKLIFFKDFMYSFLNWNFLQIFNKNVCYENIDMQIPFLNSS